MANIINGRRVVSMYVWPLVRKRVVWVLALAWDTAQEHNGCVLGQDT